MSEHTNKQFDADLESVRSQFLQMGGLVEAMIQEAIDALANGHQAPPQDQADAVLAELLGEWRDEMRWPPATGLITEREAITALRTGVAEKHSSGRSRRGLRLFFLFQQRQHWWESSSNDRKR